MSRALSRRAFLRDAGLATLGAGLATGATRGLVRGQSPSAVPAPSASASALADLQQRLKGTLIQPGDSGYVSASTPANGRYADIRPVAIARVADEEDVVTAVRWCVEEGIRPVARGGGHSYAGFSTTDGLLIDLRRLNGVDVDRASGVASVGGSALNFDLFVATEDGPLFLPGGTCFGVGVGGLALGGGIGYNAHWAGLTADRMLSSRIVLASGEVVPIDATTNPDLFWACRGGAGGSFGINTSFEFQLVEAPAHPVAWYRFDYDGADAAVAVLAAFDALIGDAPPALNAVAMAEATPVQNGDRQAAIHTMSRGQYIGPVQELEELLAPLRAAATPRTQRIGTQEFWDVQRTIGTEEPPIHNFGDISRYATEAVPEVAVQRMVDLLVECPYRDETNNGSIWNLGWVGGDVVNGIPRGDTAYVHRGVHTLWRPTTVWDTGADPAVGDALNAWTDEVIKTLAPYTPNESYQNFPNRAITDWQTAYYAENLDRLIDVKTAVDPENVFRNPQSIPTR